MRDNITVVTFPGGSVTGHGEAMWQYDYGQKIQIVGLELPNPFECHLGNTPNGTASIEVGQDDMVDIPDVCLQTAGSLYIWIYLHTGSADGETVYRAQLTIKGRAKPSGDEPTPVQQDAITKAIAALSDGVDRAETAADAAEAAVENVQETVEAALTEAKESGEFDGYSPEAKVEQTAAGATVTIKDKTGTTTANLTNGEDGYSPSAAVTQTQTGATVTITDKTGTTTAQLSNGQTPVKGTDYWTTSDKEEIISEAVGQTEEDVTQLKSAFQELEAHTDTAEYKQSIADKVAGDFVQDVQVAGASVVENGVANVPMASNSIPGVIMVGTGLGIGSTGILRPNGGSANDRRAGTNNFIPTVMATQHESAFYGLAKAAGSDEKNSTLPVGQYTEQAKSAISAMLSGSVTVSGTTPTITALPGVSYVCGEVSTIDIVTPETGIVDITFVSGATPAVLTVTPPTGMTMQWANGFDPNSLEANTTYEINIKDGRLGVAGSWT